MESLAAEAQHSALAVSGDKNEEGHFSSNLPFRPELFHLFARTK
jgi:hypothetical protein